MVKITCEEWMRGDGWIEREIKDLPSNLSPLKCDGKGHKVNNKKWNGTYISFRYCIYFLMNTFQYFPLICQVLAIVFSAPSIQNTASVTIWFNLNFLQIILLSKQSTHLEFSTGQAEFWMKMADECIPTHWVLNATGHNKLLLIQWPPSKIKRTGNREKSSDRTDLFFMWIIGAIDRTSS